MLGFPGETLEDMHRTFDFIRGNEGKMFVEGFYLTVPLPGTELWTWAVQKGYVSEQMDWQGLNLCFDNPDFDWDRFLYLNEEAVPRRQFIRAVLESGILPEAVAWRGRTNEHPNLAAEFLFRVMTSLCGEGVERVALYGAGEHTRRLMESLADAPLQIVGLLDDNPHLHGTHLGPYRIYGPDDVERIDVQAVILSSDRREEELWRQRGRFERLGIPVRRLYGPEHRAHPELCLT